MEVPNEIFQERLKLFEDTVACKRTDRVLAAPMIMYLPILMYGDVTIQDVMMDYSKAEPSFVRYHQEFQPDLAWGPQSIYPSSALDGLGCQDLKWPGKQIEDPNGGFQVLDREDGYMSPDEYLEYAEDPTGFMIRKVLPRHYSALQGLEMLDLSNAIWQGGLYSMIPAALPPVQSAFQAMAEAGGKMMKTAEAGGKIMGTLAAMGWPSATDGAFSAPFDLFNDTLRGFLNTTMDMIEYPDELLAAVETSTKMQVRAIKNTFATQPFVKTVTFFIHNGMDMFMSREQYQTFYWPGLKKCIETVIELGGTPHIYLEDKYDDKLDIFANELPPGKCIFTLINCDMEKAKELFAGKICISGGVDGTLLQYGTKEAVIENVKRSIDILAPGGGYFLNCDVSLDVAKPENLHALFDTARSYMKY
ncbi:MAG: hypothetical protein LUD01_11810 [Clostridiales bacterium]|nr:hypothetical protein [Clostridiales bacterium]